MERRCLMIIITSISKSLVNVYLLICAMLGCGLERKAHIEVEDVFLSAVKNVSTLQFQISIQDKCRVLDEQSTHLVFDEIHSYQVLEKQLNTMCLIKKLSEKCQIKPLNVKCLIKCIFDKCLLKPLNIECLMKCLPDYYLVKPLL